MSSGEVVPFLGRVLMIQNDKPLMQMTIKQLSTVLSGPLVTSTDNDWVELKRDVVKLITNLTVHKTNMPIYKLEMISEVMIPYLQKMSKSTRISLSKSRFMQLRQLILVLEDHSGNHDIIPSAASSLLEVEAVYTSVVSESATNWFNSEFQSMLQLYLTRQWAPVLADNRRGLQSLASMLAVFGILQIALPLALLYPLYVLATQFLQLNGTNNAGMISNRDQMSPLKWFLLVKSLGVVYLMSHLVALLSILPNVGSTSLFVAFVLGIISVDNNSLKKCSPLVAPHLVRIDHCLRCMQSLERSLLTRFASGASHSSPSGVVATPIQAQTQIQMQQPEPSAPSLPLPLQSRQFNQSAQQQQQQQEQDELIRAGISGETAAYQYSHRTGSGADATYDKPGAFFVGHIRPPVTGIATATATAAVHATSVFDKKNQ